MAAGAIREQDGQPQARLTSEQVWRAVTRASFAVLSHVTRPVSRAPAASCTRPPAGGWSSRSRPAAGRPGTSRPTAGSR
jgi:hypothetical protein